MAQQPAAEMDLSRLSGTFDITFVATAGAKSGQAATGRLVLRRQDAGLVRIQHADTTIVVSQPAVGQLDLMLDNIGATRMGDLMAANSSMPGVGIYVTRRRGGEVTGVLGRVGSASNTRGPAAIDAGYFALYLRRIGTDGFAGGWASSGGTAGLVTQDAQGHFCATRSSGG